jgi:hypothetical protein
MATALRLTQNALRKTYTVAASDTATEGMAVLLDSDTTVDDAGAASDLAIGVALETKTAGQAVEVALFGHSVIGVLVGTNGATRGMKAVIESDGFTDAAAHDSDGTGNEAIYGVFLQSGTAGQFVGMLVGGTSNRGA